MRILLIALALPLLAETSVAAERSVRVTARGLNVRTAEGEILCAVSRGTLMKATARHEDGDRIKVSFNVKGCPKEGYVFAKYVRPESNGKTEMKSQVEASGLSLRSRPNLDQDYWKCALPKGASVTILPGGATFRDNVSWVKVKVNHPPRGCPKEGFVAEPYLKSAVGFDDLMVAEETKDCSGATCRGQGAGPETGSATGDLEKLGKGIGRAIPDDGEQENPFIAGLKSMIAKPKRAPAGLNVNRGLVQIPLMGSRGPCGSLNYNPDMGPVNPKYVYANPLTACVFTSVLQEWKKNVCPSRDAGCRIAFGDISHKTDAGFMNRHNTHTDGYCIDIRPMRKGGFENAPLWYTNADYDRDMMRKLVATLRQHGGSNIYFNDPKIRRESNGAVQRAGGHDNHIHVCFKNNATTRKACNNLKVDPNVCPELQ